MYHVLIIGRVLINKKQTKRKKWNIFNFKMNCTFDPNFVTLTKVTK